MVMTGEKLASTKKSKSHFVSTLTAVYLRHEAEDQDAFYCYLTL